ncbi:PAS domain S-box protein [Pedobacter sp. SAFR-022]|uniref:PAS domain S-box protein n=1 Tax=Pedobacter sp. SAFR-022 TaxID=3436861 RepID=UPI003F7D715F
MIPGNPDEQQSSHHYHDLFEVSPQPSWVYDVATLRFLDVNEAAIAHYGYCRAEFLTMTLRDVRPPEDIAVLDDAISLVRSHVPRAPRKIYRHRKKNGDIIDVQIQSNAYTFNGREARLVLVNDITAIIQSKREMERSKLELLKSEARWKALVQDGSDMIAVVDDSLNYTFASESCTSILHIATETFLTSNAYDFVHPEDRRKVRESTVMLPQLKRVSLDPFRFRDGHGNWRWIKTTLTDLRDDPAVQGIVANSMDVTASIRTNEELRLSNERYKLVLKAADEAICDWDIVNDAVVWGSGFSEIFGYDLTEYNNNLWSDNIHPDDRDRVLLEVKDMINDPTRDIYYSEYRFLNARREAILVQHRGIFLRDEQGRAIRSVDTLRDITAERERLHRIEQQNKQLKEIAWAQSHHVRAPLARIMALSELLKGEVFSPKQQEVINYLSASASELDEAIKAIIKKTE